MKYDISAVIMAFNEKESLGAVAREIAGVLKDLRRTYEIIMIDDGSFDGTDFVADALAAELPNARAIHHGTNRGLGGVYRTGFNAAEGTYVTFFPADGQFPAAIIRKFAGMMDNADMVLGYLPDRRSSLVAKGLSAAERMLLAAMFGRLPEFQGIMMFRRDLLERFRLLSAGRGWTVLMELIIRAKNAGCRIVSVPTEMRQRMSGRSKVNNLRTAWDNLKQAVALRRQMRES